VVRSADIALLPAAAARGALGDVLLRHQSGLGRERRRAGVRRDVNGARTRLRDRRRRVGLPRPREPAREGKRLVAAIVAALNVVDARVPSSRAGVPLRRASRRPDRHAVVLRRPRIPRKMIAPVRAM
jgi:hypothetical protein